MDSERSVDDIEQIRVQVYHLVVFATEPLFALNLGSKSLCLQVAIPACLNR